MSIFLFLIGLCVGSFLNVCIQRWPRDESILKPRRSQCPHCEAPIGWWDNIPLVSYLLLAARCRRCRKWISPRYFFVELATGLIFLWCWKEYGGSAKLAAGLFFLPLMLAVTMTDFETGYIPDEFTYSGMIAGLVLSTIFPGLHGQVLWVHGLLRSAIGLVGGGFILYALGVIGNFLFRKESMGGGDIKLLALIGAFVGFKGALLVFFFSPVLSMPVALYMKLFKKESYMPFGPYIALSAAGFFVYADPILEYISQAYGF